MNANIRAEVDQINSLIGGTIIKPVVSPPAKYGGESFGFQVRTTMGKIVTVWVDCDPEGNGPGHLNIEK